MSSAKKIQDQFISKLKTLSPAFPISQQVIDAFYAVPRHHFIKKYRLPDKREWIEINDQNLEANLAYLYTNDPIIIHGTAEDFMNPEGKPIATISQLDLVLFMLELLKLEKGQRVFELGAASGFNAALMGHLVGPAGKVVSVEIISDLVQTAVESVKQLGLSQVEIIQGDGGDGYPQYAPYDRAVFTAGSTDLPGIFFKDVKVGGRLILILENKGGVDALILFEKKEDHFQSLLVMNCNFVSATGKHQLAGSGPKFLDQILSENQIGPDAVDHFPFKWKHANENSFYWFTTKIRSYLSVGEPMFEQIKMDNKLMVFGLLDKKSKSLVVVKHDELVSYGSTQSRECFGAVMKRWAAMGTPGFENLQVKAYPADNEVKAGNGEWLVKQKESQFLWSKSI
jgi:protein-L-isoaspartate(D-aspartate) O-methyltransferase